MTNITLFAQIINLLPKEKIRKEIRLAKTDKHCKGYNTWSQLVSMIFCHFAKCDSVRDISNGLKSATGNLNHLGINRAPSKSTVAYENEHRSSEVFRNIFFSLYNFFGQQMPQKVKKFRFKIPVKLLDSTTITVPLSMFDWAHYNTTKGAVKSHTVLNDETKLPEYVYITDGKGSDNKAAYNIPIMPHSIVVADRGYCDYNLLNYWDSIDVFFVVRCKKNVRYTSIKEFPLPDKTAQDVLIDEEIEFELPKAKKQYPKHLRRIVVWNDEHGYLVEILTNNFKLAASSISALYRERWQIEIFFYDKPTIMQSRLVSLLNY